ncbi:MAG: hypothetical protein ACOYMG_04525 [Candidatus Methylumidiphilus sp.]
MPLHAQPITILAIIGILFVFNGCAVAPGQNGQYANQPARAQAPTGHNAEYNRGYQDGQRGQFNMSNHHKDYEQGYNQGFLDKEQADLKNQAR